MRERSARPDRQYAAIPNAMMRDQRLSIEARGLLALLMTYADDWTFRRDHLMEVTGMKKDKFTRVMGELVDLGYVERIHTRDGGGKLLGKSWIIRDEPVTDVRQNRTTVTDVRKNRCPAEPLSGKTAPIRKPTDKKTNRQEHNGSGEPALFSEMEEPEKKEDPVELGFKVFWEEIWPSHFRKAARVDCAKIYRAACLGKHPKADKIAPDVLNRCAKAYIAATTDLQFLKAPRAWLNVPGWEPFLNQAPRRNSILTPQWGEVVR